MEEKQVETQKRAIVLPLLAGVLLVSLLGAGLAFASRALAQQEPATEGEPVIHGVVERAVVGSGGGIMITTETLAGPVFPFEAALNKLVAEGVLTIEDVESIMSDLSELSDAVEYSATTSPDGQTKDVTLDISIRSDDSDLPAAMQQALDNAMANGLLTAEQAAAVMAEVEAAPDPLVSMVPGTMMALSIDGPLAAEDLLNGPWGLGQRLDDAVSVGTITADEAQAFRDILTKLLAATE